MLINIVDLDARRKNSGLPQRAACDGMGSLFGRSLAMRRLIGAIERLAYSSASVAAAMRQERPCCESRSPRRGRAGRPRPPRSERPSRSPNPASPENAGAPPRLRSYRLRCAWRFRTTDPAHSLQRLRKLTRSRVGFRTFSAKLAHGLVPVLIQQCNDFDFPGG